MSKTSKSQQIFYLLYMTTLSLRVELDSRLKRHGLTTRQYTILKILSRRTQSSAELARRFLVTAPTMNEIIRSVHRAGLITRQADAENRRRLRTSLTPQGYATLKRCDAIVTRLEGEIARTLGRAQLRELEISARQLNDAFPRGNRWKPRRENSGAARYQPAGRD
jgi:DNA-binding MarR family transcriptional regulator